MLTKAFSTESTQRTKQNDWNINYVSS